EKVPPRPVLPEDTVPLPCNPLVSRDGERELPPVGGISVRWLEPEPSGTEKLPICGLSIWRTGTWVLPLPGILEVPPLVVVIPPMVTLKSPGPAAAVETEPASPARSIEAIRARLIACPPSLRMDRSRRSGAASVPQLTDPSCSPHGGPPWDVPCGTVQMSDTFAAARPDAHVALVPAAPFDVGCRAMAKRWRVYSDASGQSKIAEMPLEMKPFVDTEGAHGQGTALQKATGIAFRVSPPGYVLDWHCAPRRQYSI